MYKIGVDKENSIIAVTLTGLMALDEVDAYIAALKAAFAQYALQDYAMVIDVSGCPIQSQEMIRSMGEHMAMMPKARALAVVTGSSLAKMQIRRLFTQSYARIVTTVSEGHAWVAEGIEPSS